MGEEHGPELAGKLTVFLCHSSEDKPKIRELYRKLTASGFAPWLDEEQLIGGQRWAEVIPYAVRSSDVVLVCLSKTSVDKTGYVQREIRIALDAALERPEQATYVIPLELEACDLPHSLAHFHAIKLYDNDGYDRLMNALLHAGKQSPKPLELPDPGNAVKARPQHTLKLTTPLTRRLRGMPPLGWLAICGVAALSIVGTVLLMRRNAPVAGVGAAIILIILISVVNVARSITFAIDPRPSIFLTSLLILVALMLAGVMTYAGYTGHLLKYVTPTPQQWFKSDDTPVGIGDPRLRAKCASNLRQMGQAMQLYMNENNGRLPPTFQALLKGEGLDQARYCPAAKGALPHYVYIGDAFKPSTQNYMKWTSSINADSVLLYENPENHNRRGMNVLYADGHVEWLSAAGANDFMRSRQLLPATSR